MANQRFPLIDTHCHADAYSVHQWQEISGRARAAGVHGCLSAGVWWDELPRLLETHCDFVLQRTTAQADLTQVLQQSEMLLVLPCLGLHPMAVAERWRDPSGRFMLKQAQTDVDAFFSTGRQLQNKIWAIGETGFDAVPAVVRGWLDKAELLKAQQFAFDACMKLALELQRPLVVHSRSAWQLTQQALQTAHNRGLRSFMLHCYSGHADQLGWVERLGGFASFGGVLTWPSAVRMRQAFQRAPSSLWLLETDSPDLLPVMDDGSRPEPNEPSYLPAIASRAAHLRGASEVSIRECNFKNFVRFVLP